MKVTLIYAFCSVLDLILLLWIGLSGKVSWSFSFVWREMENRGCSLLSIKSKGKQREQHRKQEVCAAVVLRAPPQKGGVARNRLSTGSSDFAACVIVAFLDIRGLIKRELCMKE